MKRILSLALTILMLLSLAACGAPEASAPASEPAATQAPASAPAETAAHAPEPAPQTYEDAELARAVELGIGEYREDDPNVTYAEFMAMLDKAVELADETKLTAWQKVMPQAHTSGKTMTRREGMVATYFAAETLGENYYGYNTDNGIFDEIATVDDWIFWDEMWGGDYSLFPDVSTLTLNGEGSYINAGYFYSMKRISMLNGNTVFDYDAEAKTMHPAEPFIYTDALRTALRMFDSYHPLEARALSDADTEILSKADARRESILNSVTEVEVTGRSYYVSNDGSDQNPGDSPEAPWATLEKVNTAKLKSGDAVFFKREGVWRGVPLLTQQGVTYSAYGEGAKPAIYGSPENGAGAEKWSLIPGTDNIWVFYRALGDCGGIVVDGDINKVKKSPVWWTGSQYVLNQQNYHDAMMQMPAFDPSSDMNNFEYFNDIDYSDLGTQHPIYVYLESSREGKLYLRCDEGNPGEVFASIEFCCDLYEGAVAWVANDCVLDNLCVMYGGHAIENGDSRSVVRNCEVGYMGRMTHTFSEHVTVHSGDGINHMGNSFVENNYVHHVYNGGIAVGELSFAPDADYAQEESFSGFCTIKGNLLEYTSGITLINWETEASELHMFKDITIEDNYVLFAESYGAATGDTSLAVLGNLVFTGIEKPLPNANENILIKDNIFYCSKNALILSGMPERYYPTYSGNTYAQYAYAPFAYWYFRDGTYRVVFDAPGFDLAAFVRDELGDETGVVLPTW